MLGVLNEREAFSEYTIALCSMIRSAQQNGGQYIVEEVLQTEKQLSVMSQRVCDTFILPYFV